MSSEWKNLVKAYPESGTPTQENVDQSFKFFADIIVYLDSIMVEIESYKNAPPKDRKEKIEALKNKVEKEIQPKVEEKKKKEGSNENPALKKINERIEVIKSLVKPPTSIDDVIEYCNNLVKYFMGPYESLIKMSIFYGLYTTKMAEKIAETITKITATISLLDGELAKATIEAMKYGDKGVKELEEDKASEEISETFNDKILINRYNGE
jgi:hypothetical protein